MEPSETPEGGGVRWPGALPVRARMMVLATALAAGVVASAATAAVGELTHAWFAPGTWGKPELGPQFGGVATETIGPTMAKNAGLTYGAQAMILAGVLGLAGAGLSGRLPRALPAVVASAAVGGVAAAGVSYVSALVFTRLVDANSNDLLAPLLAHGAVWMTVGAAAGLAMGLGLGLGRPGLVRAVAGGAAGAIGATVVYELAGAAVFPLAKTWLPMAEELAPRVLGHAAVGLMSALGAALAATPPAGRDA